MRARFSSNPSCCSPGSQTGWKGRRGCANLSQHTWRACRQTESSSLGFCLIWRRRWWWWQRCPCKHDTHLPMSLKKKKAFRDTLTVKNVCRTDLPIFLQGHHVAIDICRWEVVYGSGRLPVLCRCRLKEEQDKGGCCWKMYIYPDKRHAVTSGTFKSTQTQRR